MAAKAVRGCAGEAGKGAGRDFVGCVLCVGAVRGLCVGCACVGCGGCAGAATTGLCVGCAVRGDCAGAVWGLRPLGCVWAVLCVGCAGAVRGVCGGCAWAVPYPDKGLELSFCLVLGCKLYIVNLTLHTSTSTSALLVEHTQR